jgi:hypothetical protein
MAEQMDAKQISAADACKMTQAKAQAKLLAAASKGSKSVRPRPCAMLHGLAAA